MSWSELLQIILLNDPGMEISFSKLDNGWNVKFIMSNGEISKTSDSIENSMSFCYESYQKEIFRKERMGLLDETI